MVRSRISREKRTVSAMVEIYCRGNHRTGTICGDCGELLEYSMKKLDKCRFSESKPACSKCPVHCYGNEMRGRMRSVMRYSGPRMALRHPVLTIQHSIDARKKSARETR
jgi:predicted amidophosphoribosyltransferase